MKPKNQVAGFSMLGSSRAIVGTVHNLNCTPGQMGTVTVTWDYEPVINDAPEFGIFLDGRLVQRVAITLRNAIISGVTDGPHSVRVIPINPDDDLDAYIGDPYGGRAYVSWPASPSRDLASYKVWMRTDPEGAYTLMGTVSDVRVQEFNLRATATGGRYSTQGSSSSLVNETLTITLNNDSSYSYSNTDASVTGSGSYDAGSNLHLPFGLLFVVHDDPEAYDGDEVSVHIGPAAEWLSSGGLPTGQNIYFAVSAVDVAGNESGKIGDLTLLLPVVPEAVSNVRWGWDSTTQIASLHFDLPNTVDEARIYSNFDTNTDAFDPGGYVILDQPHTTIAYTSGDPQHCEWQFDGTGLDGVLKLYIRTALGTTELEDTILYTFSFPPSPDEQGIVLGEPTDLAAVSKTAGRWSLSWAYEWADSGDALAGFAIYSAPSEEEIDWETPMTTQTLSSLTSTSRYYPVVRYSYDEVGTPAATEAYFGVRAVSTTGVTTLNTQVVKFTPDVAPPELSGTVIGAVQ